MPADATVAFPVGTRLEVVRLDDDTDPAAASVSIQGAVGVTVIGNASVATHRVVTLAKVGANEWLAWRSAT